MKSGLLCCISSYDIETPFEHTIVVTITLEDLPSVELIWYYLFSVLYSVCIVTCYSMPLPLRVNVFSVEMVHQEIFVSIYEATSCRNCFSVLNPSTLELNPFGQRCLTRFLPGFCFLNRAFR
jgi:hypothetical protein